jgi:hypothetical protein
MSTSTPRWIVQLLDEEAEQEKAEIREELKKRGLL